MINIGYFLQSRCHLGTCQWTQIPKRSALRRRILRDAAPLFRGVAAGPGVFWPIWGYPWLLPCVFLLTQDLATCRTQFNPRTIFRKVSNLVVQRIQFPSCLVSKKCQCVNFQWESPPKYEDCPQSAIIFETLPGENYANRTRWNLIIKMDITNPKTIRKESHHSCSCR
jgi:hypothetical protein